MQTVVAMVGVVAVFGVLLALSCKLLKRVPSRYTTDSRKEEVDHRVVHFTLRLALTFGIGAVIIGILLVAVLLAQALF